MNDPKDNGTILDDYVPNTTEGEDVVEVDIDEVEFEEVEQPANRNEATGVITVTCGANVNSFGEIAGKSIGDLRRDLADVLNIAPDTKAIVCGEETEDDYVIKPGDRVEFIKESGVKG